MLYGGRKKTSPKIIFLLSSVLAKTYVYLKRILLNQYVC